MPNFHHQSPRIVGHDLHQQVDEKSSLISAASGGSSTLMLDSVSQKNRQKNSIVHGTNSIATTSSAGGGQQNLRKFTSAISKPGQARETREAISKVLGAANPSRSEPLAEPIDYEHFISEKSAQLENDKDRDLLLFLRDDISGLEIWPRERTAIPSVRQKDIDEARWLLARDALRHYSAPYTIINFNYARFGGDFKKFDPPQGMHYLRFEYDLIMDEEKIMTGQSSAIPSDILKEGNLVVMPGDGLVDTFRSEKKRYCVLRRSTETESNVGRVYIEIFKTAMVQQQQMQQPAMEMDIKSVSIKSSKKSGKLLQLFSPESDKRALLLSAESEADLQCWLFEIERALTWNIKEILASEDTISLNSSGRETSLPPGSSSLNDSESLASEDSGGSRDSNAAFMKSRNAAAKALQPPIVERRNLFSLYWDVEPLPEANGEKSTLWVPLNDAEQCNIERSSPIPACTPVTNHQRIQLGGKRMAPQAPSSSSMDESPKTKQPNREQSQSPEPSTADFVGEKPAILFTAQIRHLDIRVRLAGREQPEQIEPFFVRLFLFDASLGSRISEEFHVSFIPSSQIGSAKNNTSNTVRERVNGISRELIQNARKLICAIRNPRPDLFLVALVERTLSDVSSEIYMKTNNAIDTKNSTKIQKSLSIANQRLGHLRTLFAWTARPVFPSLCSNGAFSSQQTTNLTVITENGTSTAGGTNNKQSVTNCSLYKCENGRLTDGELQKLLTDMQRGEKAARLVVLAGAALVLEADVTSVLCEFPMRISPSFLPLRPWKGSASSPVDKVPPAPSLELQSFLDQSLNSEPHRQYVNLLYVYPISLNYATQKAFSRARNIACTVRYIPSIDKKPSSVGNTIFHRTHPFGPFTGSFACAVQYHEQNPQFNAEVKLELPCALDEGDHLLFTFIHISVANANKTNGEHIETVVGNAWLPLVKKSDQGLPYLIMSEKSQEFELPVAASLPSNYHASYSQSDIKFVENGRPLFRVRLRLVSSVFSTEERIQTFFQQCQQLHPTLSHVSNDNMATSTGSYEEFNNLKKFTPSRFPTNNTNGICSASDNNSLSSPTHNAIIEQQLIESIEKLSYVDLDSLIPFFEVILNRLFSLLIMTKSENVAINSLSTIVNLVDQLYVHRKSKRDILRNYIRLHFRVQQQYPGADSEEDETLYCAICKCIPLLIQKYQSTNTLIGKDVQQVVSRLFRQLWFLLDCAAKSMAHWLIMRNLLKAPRRGRFPNELYFCVEELLHTLTTQIVALHHKECPQECHFANVAIGNFLRHCLSLMDRHQIMKELHSIVKKLDTIESRSFRLFKFELLQLVAAHEHWIPLCLPLLTDNSGVVWDSIRLESLSSCTQSQQSAKNSGFLSKLFSQIFSPFQGIISESKEVEKFSSFSEHFHLSATYCSVHFPIGLLFQELVASLRDSRDYRRKVIRLVRNLLIKHSRDPRYGDTSAKGRVALLNMPLVRLAIENIRELEIATISSSADSPTHSPMPKGMFKGRTSLLTAPTSELKSNHLETERRSSLLSSSANYFVPPASRMSTRTLTEVNNNGKTTVADAHNPSPVVVVLAEKLDKNEVRDLILCVLYVLNDVPKKMLSAFWNVQESIPPYKTASTSGQSEEPSPNQHSQCRNVLLDFIRLLELSLLLFRYRGRTHHIMQQNKRMKTGSGKMGTASSLQKTTNSLGTIGSQFSTLADMTLDIKESEEVGKNGEATSFLMDCNLAQEVALIVLEAVQTISNQIAAKTRYSYSDSYDSIFTRLLHLELELLAEWWPEAVRLHSLAALAVFINLFSTRFFHSGPLDCLSTLIKALLLQLNSRIVRVQNAAAALLHLILRSGYDAAFPSNSKYPTDFTTSSATGDRTKPFLTERLGRPGAQISPVLARLLSEKAIVLDNLRFERGLNALESLIGGSGAKSGVAGPNSASIVLTSLFDRAVLDLVKQLRGVIEATQAISDTINDPIQLADLHIQLANSYRGSAALRSEFFDALASQHIAGAWYSEAVVCQAHSLVIIGKELQGRKRINPDWALLNVLNERIVAEEGVNEDNLINTQQGGFTLEDFIRKVEQMVQTMLLAERYEAVGPICRLVIPIFEHNYDYKALVGIYAEIQQACSRAAEVKTSGKRHLGTYFKVSFYGQAHFGSEHQTEWIYREPKLTSLAEACDRMVESVRNALGHDRVQILSERANAPPNDPMTAFIQVAHVEPSRGDMAKPAKRNSIERMKKWKMEKGPNELKMTDKNTIVEAGMEQDDDKEDDPMGYQLHTNVRTFVQEERLIDQKVSDDAPELAKTALRRLTLTVENQFPDTRRRQRISRTAESVLNPLELACECLYRKATQIRRILSAADISRHTQHIDKGALKRLDLKKLQLFLQGSVSPTVNAGLLAYAETFTAPAQQQRYGKEGVNRLMAALKTLIGELHEALRVNEAAMGGERSEYQQMLRWSFDGMLERLPTFFGGEKFLPNPSQEDKAAIGGSHLVSGVAAEMHIFDSISGLNGR